MERNTKSLFTEVFLSGLKWQNPEKAHLVCTPVHPSREMQSLAHVSHLPQTFLITDTGKSSELDDTGIHIEFQVGKEKCEVLTTKTTPACHSSSKSGVRVKLGVHNQKDTGTTMDMQ